MVKSVSLVLCCLPVACAHRRVVEVHSHVKSLTDAHALFASRAKAYHDAIVKVSQAPAISCSLWVSMIRQQQTDGQPDFCEVVQFLDDEQVTSMMSGTDCTAESLDAECGISSGPVPCSTWFNMMRQGGGADMCQMLPLISDVDRAQIWSGTDCSTASLDTECGAGTSGGNDCSRMLRMMRQQESENQQDFCDLLPFMGEEDLARMLSATQCTAEGLRTECGVPSGAPSGGMTCSMMLTTIREHQSEGQQDFCDLLSTMSEEIITTTLSGTECTVEGIHTECGVDASSPSLMPCSNWFVMVRGSQPADLPDMCEMLPFMPEEDRDQMFAGTDCTEASVQAECGGSSGPTSCADVINHAVTLRMSMPTEGEATPPSIETVRGMTCTELPPSDDDTPPQCADLAEMRAVCGECSSTTLDACSEPF